jgi:hypothetical protein
MEKAGKRLFFVVRKEQEMDEEGIRGQFMNVDRSIKTVNVSTMVEDLWSQKI